MYLFLLDRTRKAFQVGAEVAQVASALREGTRGPEGSGDSQAGGGVTVR